MLTHCYYVLMSAQQTIPWDIVTVGRSVVDLYPGQDGRAPQDVESYHQYLGGSPVNVAVAAARAGLRSAVVTRTGDDLLRDFVLDQLGRFGVDTSWVRAVEKARTTLAICDLRDASSPVLQFFRDTPPPENAIETDDLVGAALASRMLWVTASGFAAEPSATAHDAAIEAAAQVVLDLDYRPDFWESEAQMRDRLHAVLPHADVVVGNEEESSIALGRTGTAEQLARALLETGPRLAVIKRGDQGVVAATPQGTLSQPAFDAQVVNGLGAGDAFGGQLAYGLIKGWPLQQTLRHAAAAGAIVASRRGCSIAMPTPEEVLALMAG